MPPPLRAPAARARATAHARARRRGTRCSARGRRKAPPRAADQWDDAYEYADADACEYAGADEMFADWAAHDPLDETLVVVEGVDIVADDDDDDDSTSDQTDSSDQSSSSPSAAELRLRQARDRVLGGRPQSARLMLSHALDIAGAASGAARGKARVHLSSTGRVQLTGTTAPPGQWLATSATFTPFYDPHAAADVRSVIASVYGWDPWVVDQHEPPSELPHARASKNAPLVVAAAVGGHASPERVRFAFLPRRAVATLNGDTATRSAVESPPLAGGVTALDAVAVACVRVTLKSPDQEQRLGHRGIVGAVLATGLQRAAFGDVVILPGGCEALVYCDPRHVRTLEDHLSEVGRDAVGVALIDLGDAAILRETAEALSGGGGGGGGGGEARRVTAASARLDAVLPSVVKGVPRADVAKLVKRGQIEVNHSKSRGVSLKPSAKLSLGDVVSVRHHGRFVIERIDTAPSKGGKERVVLDVTVFQ